jgi:carotenoid cleavage dioxygenase-like enzyme
MSYGFLNFKNFKMKHVIKNINGFYGLIGPDIQKHNFKNISSLHELFAGNGIIQGVFFNNGKITFVKHLIRTEKIIFEEKFGKISKDPFILLVFFILNKVNLLPNIIGVSNTAFININNKIYTLFERDQPYLIDINFNEKTIQTIGKQKINNLEHFSAHSKFTNFIEFFIKCT